MVVLEQLVSRLIRLVQLIKDSKYALVLLPFNIPRNNSPRSLSVSGDVRVKEIPFANQ